MNSYLFRVAPFGPMPIYLLIMYFSSADVSDLSMSSCFSCSFFLVFFFFFSSRRRHTRCLRDWSSDVCSSDLDEGEGGRAVLDHRVGQVVELEGRRVGDGAADDHHVAVVDLAEDPEVPFAVGKRAEIGRASCRERV